MAPFPVAPLGDTSAILGAAERIPRGIESALCEGDIGGVLASGDAMPRGTKFVFCEGDMGGVLETETGDRSEELLSETQEGTRRGAVISPSSDRREGWRV